MTRREGGGEGKEEEEEEQEEEDEEGEEEEAGRRAGSCREISLASLNLQNQGCRWGGAGAQHKADVGSSH